MQLSRKALSGVNSITSEIILVTPKMAKEFLTRNVQHNRPVSKSQVKTLADSIKNGDWAITHQGLAFDDAGNLLDGQHRLWAIIQADTAVYMMVTHGLVASSMGVIDTTARKRTCADIFSMRGEKNAVLLASGANLLYRFLPDGGYAEISRQPSQPELDRVLKSFPALREWASFATSHRVLSGGYQASIVVALGVLFDLCDSEVTTAEEFFLDLKNGEGLEAVYPIFHLRNALIKNMGRKESLGRKHLIWLTIKTWNAIHTGQEMKLLRISSHERFPYIFGLELDVYV